VRSRAQYDRVKRLALLGWRDCDISCATGVPARTVNQWRRGDRRGPSRRPRTAPVEPPGPPWRPVERSVYSYLLGLYLGDGHVSIPVSGSSFLRLFLDSRHHGVVDEAAAAIAVVTHGSRVTRQRKTDQQMTILQCTWRRWPDAFPQYGPGPKHERSIELTPWQEEVVTAYPRELLRGLIHSDGCRTVNRFSTCLPSGRVAEYAYVRYFFSNRSEDILRLFADACDRLGVHTTRSNHRNLSVSRRDGVAVLDSFVGPKT